MPDAPATIAWLTIVGIGEDGLTGLADASRAAIEAAEIIFGGARHLALAQAGARGREWPKPFSVAPLLAFRGRTVVALVSGDPFWHGAGATLAASLEPGEWTAHAAPSTFSLAAARLGWHLEDTLCLGLHAAPLARLRPLLSRGMRAIVLMRDGAAVAALADWLCAHDFAPTELTVMEALGGPLERIRRAQAQGYDLDDAHHPVAVALEVKGGLGMPRSSGLPDTAFSHDGQITKRPMRALTLSALAPRPGERLWDIGAGSGSISIEWLLAAPGATAIALEADAARAARIAVNAERFGLEQRLAVINAKAPDGLGDAPEPDAVFIGGGASEALLDAVWRLMPAGTRLVANAVTLESEMLFSAWAGRVGGHLSRVEICEAEPLGRKRGWRPTRPVVQWSVTR